MAPPGNRLSKYGEAPLAGIGVESNNSEHENSESQPSTSQSSTSTPSNTGTLSNLESESSNSQSTSTPSTPNTLAMENSESQPSTSQPSTSTPSNTDTLSNLESESSNSQSTSTPSTPSTSSGVRTRNASRENKLIFKFTNMYTEQHKSPIFCIQFNHLVKNISVFACCGGNRVSVYECRTDGTLKYLQCYADNDVEKQKEQFYTCAWSYKDDTYEPILAVAGLRGVIRIIQTKNMNCSEKFIGHGGEINEVKFHPKKNNLLLSASKDHCIRLWNVKTFVCVASFPGEPNGHRDSVLSLDFDMEGNRFASCGMDHAVKFWKLDTHKMKKAIARSENYDRKNNQKSFPTYIVYEPDFTTRDVHTTYIDCIRWFGNFIISKSNNNLLKFWNSENPSMYHNICCEHCDLWFLKFSMDAMLRMIALGNRTGKIFVWNVNVTDPALIPCTTLTNIRCTTTIRHTGFNRQGSILIGVGDDGTIWRYDRVV